MGFDFTSQVAAMRKVTQKVLGALAYYEDLVNPGLVALQVRWHSRVAVTGDLADVGYANIIDGVNRIIFDRDELAEKGVELARGGKITFSSEHLVGTVLILGEREPHKGPVEEIWQVME